MAIATLKNQPPLFEIPSAMTRNSRILQAAGTVLSLTHFSMEFADVKRVPRYCPGHRENDSEHSFMVAFIGGEICRQYFPDLDDGLVTKFGLVHDAIEWKTGDVATFKLSDAEAQAKETNEHDALPCVAGRLPQRLGDLLLRYESQDEDEAVIIKYIDKQLPVTVDILGPGKMVLAEDYGVFTGDELQTAEVALDTRLRAKLQHPRFEPLHSVRAILAEMFAEQYAA